MPTFLESLGQDSVAIALAHDCAVATLNTAESERVPRLRTVGRFVASY